jgi:hypothetical protein
MNLIKLKIYGGRTFWRLGTLLLTNTNPISSLIDIDNLLPIQKEIINKSIRYGEIRILDADNNVIAGDLNGIKNIITSSRIIPGEEVEDDIPEINCVTVSDKEDEEEKPIPQEAIDEAKIILSKNQNTIKKILSVLTDVDILNACYIQEKLGKARKNIVDLIEERISSI